VSCGRAKAPQQRAHSKTWRQRKTPWLTRQRFGARALPRRFFEGDTRE